MALKLNLTNHAYQRYLERVSESAKRHEAANKLTQLVNVSKDSESGDNESTIYYSKGLAIIVANDGVNVLTVFRKSRFNDCDLFNNIIKIAKREVFKEERHLNTLKRDLLIEWHEAEIRKLKVFNPETKAVIQRKVNELTAEITDVNDSLRQAKDVRRKFGI